MRHVLGAVGLWAAAVGTAVADEGLWLVNQPPVRQLRQRYGFEPSVAWLEHLQKSAVRFNSGGSGSLVSSEGLVMTNHHVASDALAKLSTPQRNLLETGFYAATRADELKCPDLELNILWTIEDVTDRVNAAVRADMPPAEAHAARREAILTIEQESEQRSGLDAQVVTLYHGARYHLYGYRRYTDVRLVFAPEQQIAFFGGDTDNFEYPRFCLDVSFLRIYENGQPLRPEHWLRWSHRGASEGELTFVLGHPGRTSRLYTVDHLKFLRDVEEPWNLQRLWRREVQLLTFSGRSPENARIAADDLAGVQNGRKARTGMLAALLDPQVLRRKVQAEQALRAAVESDPARRAQWGDAWDEVARAQRIYREFYARRALLLRMRSDLLSIALHLVRLAEEREKPNAQRLPEYSDARLDSLYLELYSPAPIHDALEIDRLTSALSHLCETFGAEDPLVLELLDGRSPQQRAAQLVRGTQLKDLAVRRRLAEGGRAAIEACDDPLIRFAQVLDPPARALRKRYEDEVESLERRAYARIAAAQFAVSGADVYPDATFTLRLSFGPIRGYREDGRELPPFTTLAGLYQRAEERRGEKPFGLPARWVERRGRLNLDTPLDFVSTADIIGGNSGSPVVNRAGEVVGLIFDGNLQSLVWDVLYTDEQARAIAVDSRGIIEALDKVYDARALVEELTGGPGASPRAGP